MKIGIIDSNVLSYCNVFLFMFFLNNLFVAYRYIGDGMQLFSKEAITYLFVC